MPEEVVRPRPRIVVISVVPRRRDVVVDELRAVIERGGAGMLVTADGTDPSTLPPGMEHLDLAPTERRLGLNRLVTPSLLRLVWRIKGGSKPTGPSWAWERWSRCRPYRVVRPWLLWRSLRRHLDVVRPGEIDHVIIVALESWPIAWQLHKLNPDVTIGWETTPDVFERVCPTPPAAPNRSLPAVHAQTADGRRVAT